MKPNRILKGLALAAVVFGLVTIVSGGRALFGSTEVRAEMGHTVPFVLWFNFLAGFLYVFAGAGLLWDKRWAAHLSLLLAISTLAVFAAFGIHVFGGGAYETRTLGAMSLRSLFWVAVAVVSFSARMPQITTEKHN
ncbi:MAG: hypothetical protein PSV13_19260 [Lacunisphaera sp.]|nr:hypothetical protein [Lacunisphaera sp.]